MFRLKDRQLAAAIVLAIIIAFGAFRSLAGPGHVMLETTEGMIGIKLAHSEAPFTVENFIQYVNDGHYDNTVFHRVIPGFMVQGGGFTSDGERKPTRDPIPLEADGGLKNLYGWLAMARTNDPDSASSQFFINIADNPHLDRSSTNPGYAVFGEVVSGMEIIDKIALVQTTKRYGRNDWPVDDVLILRAYQK